jgi:putative hydrolase of the HAD superfamily
MAFDPRPITTVSFDYGNTLIPFDREHVDRVDAMLGDHLRSTFGSFEGERLREIRHRDRMRPYTPPDFRENELYDMTRDMIRALYDRTPTDAEVAGILLARRRAFVEVVTAGNGTHALLEALAARYRLTILSNYPDATAIRQSLERTGLLRFIDVVVVSGELGRVKPHPYPFHAMLAAAEATPDETVHVGDNWLADVQGAKRVGMAAVHLTAWDTPEAMPQSDDDIPPDAVIATLDELAPLLLS